MRLKVNGTMVEMEVTTLIEVLESEGVDTGQSGIAVAVNDTVISRHVWGETRVEEGDRVEIVTAMQGG